MLPSHAGRCKAVVGLHQAYPDECDTTISDFNIRKLRPFASLHLVTTFVQPFASLLLQH